MTLTQFIFTTYDSQCYQFYIKSKNFSYAHGLMYTDVHAELYFTE